MGAQTSKVFISYSHDSEEHARRVLALADRLRAGGIDAILDQYETSPPEGWPRWMDRHIRDADFVVMVCTETYLRRVMGEEQAGTGLGVRWEGNLIYQHLYDAETVNRKFVPAVFDRSNAQYIPTPVKGGTFYVLDAEYEGFYRRLTDQPHAKRPELGALQSLPTRQGQWADRPPAEDSLGELHAVPELPAQFILRPNEILPLKAKVLSAQSTRVGVTGMGGIGKSVLATALARDDEVRNAFPDGVCWIALGQSPDLLARQSDLLWMLVGERGGFKDTQEGRVRLQAALKDRRALVILDDVWRSADAQAFNVIENPGRLLLTTRHGELIKSLGAPEHQVDKLSRLASLDLLAQTSGVPRADLPPQADQIADECGDLPLALALAGGMIEGQPDMWEMVLSALHGANWDQIERDFLDDYPYRHVFAAIEASVDALGPEKERYLDLAVFPEEMAIPETALRVLWEPVGLNPLSTRKLMQRFVGRSLAARDTHNNLMLHDLQGDFVRKRVSDLPGKHRRMLEGYRKQLKNGWSTGPKEDYYFWRHLPWHLQRSDCEDQLRSLLLDYTWLTAKLNASDVNSLISDYALLEGQQSFGIQYYLLVQQALRLSGHIIASFPRQLAAQLLGRLASGDDASIADLLSQARNHCERPALLPIRPTLNPPGTSLIRTFTGHQRSVSAVSYIQDGQTAISGSEDGTLRLWDLETARELRCLGDDKTRVMAVAAAPDGRRVLSGAENRMLYLWDIQSGLRLREFRGHEGAVTAVAVLPNGQHALSAAEDWTLRLWDIDSGKELRCFQGHDDWVAAISVSSDGQYAISGSFDKTLRLWDVKKGIELRRFDGHSGTVRAVAVAMQDKCAISGADDRTLRLWDLEIGTELRRFEGHEASITGVAVTPDGRHAVSASEDRTLRLWDLENGSALRLFHGHNGGVTAVAVLDGERALSGSRDKNLALWDLKGRAKRRPEGHDRVVSAVAVTPDEKLVVSGSADRTLRLWDLQDGTELRRFEGHSRGINDVAVTADGRRAVSASYDATLRLWDLESGEELCRLEGHGGKVTAVAVSPCGYYAVSGSFDDTLRLWDLRRGTELRRFRGHKNGVTRVAITPDGRKAISASFDRSLRLWDLASGEELRRFDGHQDAATSVAVTPDGCHGISGSFDGMLRLWDLGTGMEVCRSEPHQHYARVLDVTPDSQFVVSAYLDYALYLWDLKTCTTRTAFHGDAPITCCAISRDGSWVIAGDRAGSIHALELLL